MFKREDENYEDEEDDLTMDKRGEPWRMRMFKKSHPWTIKMYKGIQSMESKRFV